jgi:hypothetical protein
MSKQSLPLGYGFYLSIFSFILLTALAIHFPAIIFHLYHQLGDNDNNALYSNHYDMLSDVLSEISYIGGIGFGLKASLKLREFNECEAKMSLSIPIILALTSAILLGLPTFMNVCRDTTLGTNSNINSNINSHNQTQTSNIVEL